MDGTPRDVQLAFAGGVRVKMFGAGLKFEPNSLYYGDCLAVLRDWPAGCVDLVYLDPPFNSKANYNVLYGSRNGASAQVRAFSDTWHWDAAAAERMEDLERAPGRRSHKVLMGLRTILGDSGMLAYLSYMAERLEACRHVMTDRASLWLHCDPTASHYLKVLLDGIFGAGRAEKRNRLVLHGSRLARDAAVQSKARHPVLVHEGRIVGVQQRRGSHTA